MEKISYKLPAFEGPLDLLLHLISKNKLNIYDISISELLNQYMEHLDLMKENNMDVASEFLDMASRLVEIKSYELLPKYEEGEKLKEELQGQLLEYQECRKAAKPGDSVLLSPACASWGMFDNYEQRGDIFRSMVQSMNA